MGKNLKSILIANVEHRTARLLELRFLRKGYDVKVLKSHSRFMGAFFVHRPDLMIIGHQSMLSADEYYDWLVTAGLDRRIPVIYLAKTEADLNDKITASHAMRSYVLRDSSFNSRQLVQDAAQMV